MSARALVKLTPDSYPPIHLFLNVGGHKLKAFVDTGSDISFLNPDRLPADLIHKTENKLTTEIEALKDTTIIPHNSQTPFHQITYTTDVSDRTLTDEFIITNIHTDEDILLGRDWIYK